MASTERHEVLYPAASPGRGSGVTRSLALVIADTRQHVLARNAVLHSVRSLAFSQVLIYTDRPDAWPGLAVRHVTPMAGPADYNRLIVHRLAQDLEADHALVIQYDGFVLNPEEFSPHFRHYDYISAPWPQASPMEVGNGGFSWRSRRLVEAVARQPYDGEQQAEDLHICRDLRPLLERRHGVRFAPRAIAAHFALESVPLPWPTFGFHGVVHLPAVYHSQIDYLLKHLSPHTLQRWQMQLRPAFQQVSTAAALRFEQRLKALALAAA